MQRAIIEKLYEWKNDPRRKPLLLQGARQVGKTYIIEHFASIAYSDFIYLNFEKTPTLKSIFQGDLIPEKLIEEISLLFGRKIHAEKSLIFFDEIQACQEALTSLKYFFEDIPQFHIVAAGSLLGVSMGSNSSFPVGKVNFLQLYPLSFTEYLIATGNELLAEKLEKPSKLPENIHDQLLETMKLYFLIGGMPEALADYIKNKDIKAVRRIQNDILNAYKRDFSKYAEPNQAIKIAELWGTIPYQLAKENKKFMFSDVKAKARASNYEQSIEWLKNAGLVHVVPHIRAAKLPIAGYADHAKFKLYMLDPGLLGAMLKLPPAMVLKPNDLYAEYNGAFVENFACLELAKTLETSLYYWTSESDAEVDFVFEYENEVFPLEVKSGTNRNTKSLNSYANKYKPTLLLRASPRNFEKVGDFKNIPLYGLLGIRALLNSSKKPISI